MLSAYRAAQCKFERCAVLYRSVITFKTYFYVII